MKKMNSCFPNLSLRYVSRGYIVAEISLDSVDAAARPVYGVVAFAFGMPWDVPANRRIAEAAMRKALEFSAPIFTQKDMCILRNYRGHGDCFDVTRILEGNWRSGPPSTLQMTREATRWAVERGINHILIVAADPHAVRCCRDMRLALAEANEKNIVVELVSFIESDGTLPKEGWFRPNSPQFRMRFRWFWWLPEFMLNHMPVVLYRSFCG